MSLNNDVKLHNIYISQWIFIYYLNTDISVSLSNIEKCNIKHLIFLSLKSSEKSLAIFVMVERTFFQLVHKLFNVHTFSCTQSIKCWYCLTFYIYMGSIYHLHANTSIYLSIYLNELWLQKYYHNIQRQDYTISIIRFLHNLFKEELARRAEKKLTTWIKRPRVVY